METIAVTLTVSVRLWMIKLFVDDIRKCPEGWELARTVTDAIRVLATGYVSEISLDHDIMIRERMRSEEAVMAAYIISEESFEPVARYIALMPNKPKVYFHTANFDAGRKMAEIIGVEYVNDFDVVPESELLP